MISLKQLDKLSKYTEYIVVFDPKDSRFIKSYERHINAPIWYGYEDKGYTTKEFVNILNSHLEAGHDIFVDEESLYGFISLEELLKKPSYANIEEQEQPVVIDGLLKYRVCYARGMF